MDQVQTSKQKQDLLKKTEQTSSKSMSLRESFKNTTENINRNERLSSMFQNLTVKNLTTEIPKARKAAFKGLKIGNTESGKRYDHAVTKLESRDKLKKSSALQKLPEFNEIGELEDQGNEFLEGNEEYDYNTLETFLKSIELSDLQFDSDQEFSDKYAKNSENFSQFYMFYAACGNVLTDPESSGLDHETITKFQLMKEIYESYQDKYEEMTSPYYVLLAKKDIKELAKKNDYLNNSDLDKDLKDYITKYLKVEQSETGKSKNFKKLYNQRLKGSNRNKNAEKTLSGINETREESNSKENSTIEASQEQQTNFEKQEMSGYKEPVQDEVRKDLEETRQEGQKSTEENSTDGVNAGAEMYNGIPIAQLTEKDIFDPEKLSEFEDLEEETEEDIKSNYEEYISEYSYTGNLSAAKIQNKRLPFDYYDFTQIQEGHLKAKNELREKKGQLSISYLDQAIIRQINLRDSSLQNVKTAEDRLNKLQSSSGNEEEIKKAGSNVDSYKTSYKNSLEKLKKLISIKTAKNIPVMQMKDSYYEDSMQEVTSEKLFPEGIVKKSGFIQKDSTCYVYSMINYLLFNGKEDYISKTLIREYEQDSKKAVVRLHDGNGRPVDIVVEKSRPVGDRRPLWVCVFDKALQAILNRGDFKVIDKGVRETLPKKGLDHNDYTKLEKEGFCEEGALSREDISMLQESDAFNLLFGQSCISFFNREKTDEIGDYRAASDRIIGRMAEYLKQGKIVVGSTCGSDGGTSYNDSTDTIRFDDFDVSEKHAICFQSVNMEAQEIEILDSNVNAGFSNCKKTITFEEFHKYFTEIFVGDFPKTKQTDENIA